MTAEKEDKETDVKKKAREESRGRTGTATMTTTQFIFPVANAFNIGRSQRVLVSHGVKARLGECEIVINKSSL